MPIFQFICDCGTCREEFVHSYGELVPPTCCGKAMDRNYQKEHFGGIAHREKGTEYARGFVETFGGNDHVFIKSRAHHAEELKKRNLTWKGSQAPEAVYRRKHAKDRVRTWEREHGRKAG